MADDFFSQFPEAEQKDDFFSQFPETSPDSSTALGAAGRGAVRQVVPTIGAIAAGVWAGTATGTALGAPTGPGALIAGLIGGIAGGYAASKAQDVGLETFMAPEDFRALKQQEATDVEQHPWASLAGELVPQALTARPSIGNIRTAASFLRTSMGEAKLGTDALKAYASDPKNAKNMIATINVLFGAGTQASFSAYDALHGGDTNIPRIMTRILTGALFTGESPFHRAMSKDLAENPAVHAEVKGLLEASTPDAVALQESFRRNEPVSFEQYHDYVRNNPDIMPIPDNYTKQGDLLVPVESNRQGQIITPEPGRVSTEVEGMSPEVQAEEANIIPQEAAPVLDEEVAPRITVPEPEPVPPPPKGADVPAVKEAVRNVETKVQPSELDAVMAEYDATMAAKKAKLAEQEAAKEEPAAKPPDVQQAAEPQAKVIDQPENKFKLLKAAVGATKKLAGDVFGDKVVWTTEKGEGKDVEIVLEQDPDYPDIVNLETITTPSHLRGKGLANKAMTKLLAAVDKLDMTIYGSIDPDAAVNRGETPPMNRKQLANWYRKFGFQVNAEATSMHRPSRTEQSKDMRSTTKPVEHGKQIPNDDEPHTFSDRQTMMEIFDANPSSFKEGEYYNDQNNLYKVVKGKLSKVRDTNVEFDFDTGRNVAVSVPSFESANIPRFDITEPQAKVEAKPVGQRMNKGEIKTASYKDLQSAVKRNELPISPRSSAKELRQALYDHMVQNGHIRPLTAEQYAQKRTQFKKNMVAGKQRKEWESDQAASQQTDKLLSEGLPEGTEVVVKGDEGFTSWRVAEVLTPDNNDLAKSQLRYMLRDDVSGEIREVSSRDVDIAEQTPEVDNEVLGMEEGIRPAQGEVPAARADVGAGAKIGAGSDAEAFALKAESEAELKARTEKADRMAAMKDRANKPLQGNAGDITQMNLIQGGDENLFNQPAAKPVVPESVKAAKYAAKIVARKTPKKGEVTAAQIKEAGHTVEDFSKTAIEMREKHGNITDEQILNTMGCI